ncbi:hypothetical protein [Moorena producens]|uniref:hypothetical protein n=1 Tax=Moorena producens TaxID=1155739 RepID=UPI003C775D71
MGHLLQITIARKTLPFSKKNYTISRDRELQKWAISANHDRKKNYAVFLENYTVSRDRSFQNFTGRIASDSLEK